MLIVKSFCSTKSFWIFSEYSYSWYWIRIIRLCSGGSVDWFCYAFSFIRSFFRSFVRSYKVGISWLVDYLHFSFTEHEAKQSFFFTRYRNLKSVSFRNTYLLQTPQDCLHNSSTLNISFKGMDWLHMPFITNESQSGCSSWHWPTNITYKRLSYYLVK